MIEIPSLRVLSEEEIEWNEWIYIDNDIQKNIEMDDVCNNVNKNGYRKAWENIEMEGGMEYGWGDGWWTCWDFTVLKHGDVFEQAGNTNWNQKFVLLRRRCTNRSKEKKSIMDTLMMRKSKSKEALHELNVNFEVPIAVKWPSKNKTISHWHMPEKKIS